MVGNVLDFQATFIVEVGRGIFRRLLEYVQDTYCLIPESFEKRGLSHANHYEIFSVRMPHLILPLH